MRLGRLPEAEHLFERAAEAGLPAAWLRYGQYLLHFGDPSAAADPALAWLQRARSAGSATAALVLAGVALGELSSRPDTLPIAEALWFAANAGQAEARRVVAALLADSPAPRWRAIGRDGLLECARRGDPLAAQLFGVVPSGVEASMVSAPDPSPERLADYLASALQAPPSITLAESPVVKYVDAAFSPLACQYLMAFARPRLRRSRVHDPRANGEPLQSGLRTSSDCTIDSLEEDFFLRFLQARMARLAALPLVMAEPLVVLRYAPGEEYRPHRDYLSDSALAAHRPQAGQRIRTVCAYLSAVASGGETDFPTRGVRVPPQVGRALVFDNVDSEERPAPNSLHAGLPVQTGEKWLATLWLRKQRYRSY